MAGVLLVSGFPGSPGGKVRKARRRHHRQTRQEPTGPERCPARFACLTATGEPLVPILSTSGASGRVRSDPGDPRCSLAGRQPGTGWPRANRTGTPLPPAPHRAAPGRGIRANLWNEPRLGLFRERKEQPASGRQVMKDEVNDRGRRRGRGAVAWSLALIEPEHEARPQSRRPGYRLRVSTALRETNPNTDYSDLASTPGLLLCEVALRYEARAWLLVPSSHRSGQTNPNADYSEFASPQPARKPQRVRSTPRVADPLVLYPHPSSGVGRVRRIRPRVEDMADPPRPGGRSVRPCHGRTGMRVRWHIQAKLVDGTRRSRWSVECIYRPLAEPSGAQYAQRTNSLSWFRT